MMKKLMSLALFASLVFFMSCTPDKENYAAEVVGVYQGMNDAKAFSEKVMAISATVTITELSVQKVRIVYDNNEIRNAGNEEGVRYGNSEVVFESVNVTKDGDQFILSGSDGVMGELNGTVIGHNLQLTSTANGMPTFIFNGNRVN